MKRTGGIILALALVSATAGDRKQDTWTGVERLVAVGDVHGDYGQFVKVLQAAQVIDEAGRWIGGKTHLVQTGDVLDRGAESRKAMDLLMQLETEAAKAGGAVHALIGNHEALVLLGQWHYVTPGEFEAFGGEEEFRRAMSADGRYGKWIRGHNAVVKINECLFVHGGLTADLAANHSLAEINAAVRADLAKNSGSGLAMDPGGPLWDRSLAEGDEDRVAREADAVLKKYGARHIVIGHTVSQSGVAPRAGGRVVQIDVGLSAYYGGPAACLVIEKGVLSELRAGEGPRRLLPDAPAIRPAASRPAA
jgi:hypothetical protein